ncbi:hypothetical protein [uncultured Desulfobacter sp.]|uniref:hypothetical protein n=1 Tax=uncultured Desulfobacter sp. TaxID=240139 RepID=UPI002AAC3014|nr:hypothetical protein [uncultured Desulfobacter sp.]
MSAEASLRASQERLVYIPSEKYDDGVAKIIYTAKDRKSQKMFNALDWLASLVTHIPGRYEHTVRYYGYFKIYEVDPLVCPKCQGQMKIISFIEDLDIIEKILRHLGLWDIHNHDPPQAVISDPIPELVYDFLVSQIPAVEYWN